MVLAVGPTVIAARPTEAVASSASSTPPTVSIQEPPAAPAPAYKPTEWLIAGLSAGWLVNDPEQGPGLSAGWLVNDPEQGLRDDPLAAPPLPRINMS